METTTIKISDDTKLKLNIIREKLNETKLKGNISYNDAVQFLFKYYLLKKLGEL